MPTNWIKIDLNATLCKSLPVTKTQIYNGFIVLIMQSKIYLEPFEVY